MCNLSDQVNRKFTDTIAISDWEIDTDTGWQPITHIHQTVPYTKWTVITSTGKSLDCADTHILFLSSGEQVYACNLQPGTSTIRTVDGDELVTSILCHDIDEPMYDVTVDSPDHRFYTNGILSHNTTLLDALCFGLYGKPLRNINKPTLINSINEKNLEVEITFSTQNNTYVIRRGLKPNIFQVKCNGILMEELPSMGDMQNHIEKYILKCNYKAFTQCVILGAASYIPFMRLPAASRREILEDVLDIEVFSSMQILAKTHVAECKEQLQQAQSEVAIIQSQEDLIRNYADMWEKRQQEERTRYAAQISQIQTSITELQNANVAITKDIDKWKKKANTLSDTEAKHSKAINLVAKFSAELQHLEHSHDFFTEHDNCPTCMQNIDGDFKQAQLETASKSIEDIRKKLAEANDIAAVLHKKIQTAKDAQRTVDTILSEQYKNTTQIATYESQIARIQEHIQRTYDPPPQAPSVVGNLSDALQKVDEITYQRLVYEQCVGLLKDNGIRTKVIQQYIPIINKWVNYYLHAMNFPVQFTLDDQFNESIKSRYRDEFSYENFSEGEKRRIDLALILTWRAIARMKNSVYTNLLIFDEIFDSSMDAAGIEDFLRVIETMDTDTNIFVISHKTEALIDKFKSAVMVTKERGFSVVKEL